MRKLLLQTGVFLLAALLVYFIHVQFIVPYFEGATKEFVSFNYKFNLGLTVLYLIIFYNLFRVDSSFLGFAFLTLSGFKLIIYLFLINKLELSLGRERFLHFFLPYLLGLGIEFFFVYRLLNHIKS